MQHTATPHAFPADDGLMLALALRHQRAARFDAAAAICHDILRAEPGQPAALHRLGVLTYLQGNPDAAAALLEQAITAHPEVAEFRVSLCLAEQAAGRHDRFAGAAQAAAALCRDILARDPDNTEALHRLGVLADLRGEHRAGGELLARAAALAGDQPEIFNNLGLALQSDLKPEAAERAFRDALRLDPDYVGPLSNLAIALEAQGKIDDAIAACARLLEVRPDFAPGWFNLGNLQEKHARKRDALTSFRKAAELQPLALQPQLRLAHLLHYFGEMDEAVAVYRAAQRNVPDAGLDILLATMLPPIIPSAAAVAVARERYERSLAAVLQAPARIRDLRAAGHSNFYLPYLGYSDKPLQEMLARAYAQARPDLLWNGASARPAWDGKRRLKVGFISSFFNNHSIGKLCAGIIANIDRNRIEATTLFAPPFVDDDMSSFVAEHSEARHVLPEDLQQAREFIAGLRLDVLFYTDIGMDMYCYLLAFSRLAPVQCTTWGHPNTTGIAAMDYFITHDDCEAPGAQSHYSEKLIYIHPPANFTFFWRPAVPDTLKPRAAFGLADGEHIYICPQSLFKFHPDFDAVLEAILRRDSLARLVLIDGAPREWNALLLQRFAAVMPAQLLSRITFVPRQAGGDFLNLIAVSDVMLDAFPFAGGTSSFEGFATGIPIVTMPTQLLRGRCTHACYRRMDIAEYTAATPAEYVEIALRLGTDAAYRNQARARILARNHLLYGDLGAVREFERCFAQMVTETDAAADATAAR